jgi:hypothetical protein
VDPRETGELIGRLIIPVLGTIGCVWLGVRAASAPLRSQRLAGLGLAFGLAMIPLAAVAALSRGSGGRTLLLALGGVVALTGIVAVWLGVKAGAARAREHSAEGNSGTWALATGILGILSGLALGAWPFLLNPAASGTPWVHKIDPTGVEVTLPSARWRKVERPGHLAAFGCRQPQMVASVMEVRPASTPEDFERPVNDLKRLVSKNASAVLDEKRGRNAAGHEHWLTLTEENTPNGRVLVGTSVTWWKKSHAVIIIFEGQHKMMSQTGQSQETEAFRAAAATILGSVK